MPEPITLPAELDAAITQYGVDQSPAIRAEIEAGLLRLDSTHTRPVTRLIAFRAQLTAFLATLTPPPAPPAT